MAVVAALHLDDQVPPGDRPHQVDSVHRRLGAGVGEAPQRQPEPPGQVFGHDDGVLGGLGEVRASGHPGGDRARQTAIGRRGHLGGEGGLVR